MEGTVFLKLRRAQEHIDAFGEQSVSYLNSNFCRLDFHDDGEFRHVFLVVDQQPPLRLAGILGDAVHEALSSHG